MYAPPSTDAFDTIDCARRAARVAPQAPAALVLPTIDVVTSLGPSAAGGVARRLTPLPVAVAAGLMLVATGTASSLALWSSLPPSGTGANLTAAPAVASDATSTTVTPPKLAPVSTPPPVATVADPPPSVRPKTPRAKDAIRVYPRESVPAPTSSPVAWQPETSPPPPAPSSAAPHRHRPWPPAAQTPRPTQKPTPQHPPTPQPAPPSSQPAEGGRTPADHGDSLPPALSPPHSAGQPGHHDAESVEDGQAKKEKKPKKPSDDDQGEDDGKEDDD